MPVISEHQEERVDEVAGQRTDVWFSNGHGAARAYR